VAAKLFGAAEIIDPRPFAAGTIRAAYERYPHIGPVLPAMGYSAEQVSDLQATINNADCELVLFATPIQLTRVLALNKPALRVRYEYKDHGEPTLEQVFLNRLRKGGFNR